MKGLLIIPGFILCMIATTAFAQAGHATATGAGSNTPAGSYTPRESNFSSGGSSYNNSYSGSSVSSSSTRSESTTQGGASPASLNNNAGYVSLPGNYSSYNYSGGTYTGNGYTGAYSGGRSANPSAPTRYNYAAGRYYTYYPTALGNAAKGPKTVKKFNADMRERHERDRYPLASALSFGPYYSTFYFPCLFYDRLCDAGRITQKVPARSNSALNVSLDGFVVHGADTLYGIVTMTKHNVFVEQLLDSRREYGYHFPYSDKDLKSVVVYRGNEELLMIRLREHDTKLSRVLHLGHLSIFDDVCSFTDKIDQAHLKVSYDGKVHTLSAFVVLDMKRKLLNAVHKAYGEPTDPAQFDSEREVIHYIYRYF